MLGCVVRASAVMERSLRILVAALLGSDSAVHKVAGRPVSRLADMARQGSATRGDLSSDTVSDLETLLQQCGDVADDRGRLAHNSWGYDPDGAAKTIPSRDALTVETFNVAEMADLYWRIDRLIDKLLTWTRTNLPQDAASEVGLRWKKYLKQVSEPELQILIEGGALDLLATAKPVMPHEDGSLPDRLSLPANV